MLQKGGGVISQSCSGFLHYMEAKDVFILNTQACQTWNTSKLKRRGKMKKRGAPPKLAAKNRLFLLISWFSYSHSVHKNRFDFLGIKRKMKAKPLSLEQDSSLQGCGILWTLMTLSQRERCLMSFFFYTLKLMLGKMSWESLGRIEGGGWIISSSKDEGESVIFYFP